MTAALALALTLGIATAACVSEGASPTGAAGGGGASGAPGTVAAGRAGADGSGGASQGGAPEGGSGGAPAPSAICDGSSGLRFAAVMLWNDTSMMYDGVNSELGVVYLYIDGRCRYFAWEDSETTLGQWAPTRSGVLDAATVTELERDFSYTAWPDLEGGYWGEGATIAFPSIRLSDGVHRIECLQPCENGPPSEIVQAAAAFRHWHTRLYAAGEDMDGPIRLRVFDSPDNEAIPTQAWPLSRQPEEYAEPPGTSASLKYGPAPRITDATELAALRALRVELAARESPTEAARVLSDTMGLMAYGFRDVIPLETEDGYVPGFSNEEWW